jgi:hypothetical protein
MLVGLEAFDASVKAWFGNVRTAVAEASVGLAHHAFETILETSPQYSGDFVANTRVSIGEPLTTFDPFVVDRGVHNPFKMGDTPAQTYARGKAKWDVPKLGQSIFISSTAKHDDFYSWLIEDGQIKLRPENQGGHHIYRRALYGTQHTYANIGKTQFAILRKVGV